MNKQILVEKNSASDVVIVTFGGLISNNRKGEPVFEFRNMLQPLGHNVIYVRDRYQSWYHKCFYNVGYKKSGTTIQQLANKIRDHILSCQAKKVVFLGNSAGGYAALLFGSILEPDEVHAFVPQTFLGIYKKWKFKDNRYKALHRKVLFMNLFFPSEWKRRDLQSVFKNKKKLKTQFTIRYGDKYALDKIHAHQLAFHDNVSVITYPSCSHYMIKELKDSGELMKIIENAIKI